MTEHPISKQIAEAKCLGSLVAIDTAYKAGSLTDAERDRLLDGLVPLHEDHNREVAELVRQVLAASEPEPIYDIDLSEPLDALEADGTLVVFDESNKNDRWGQSTTKGTAGRTGHYDRKHRRIEDGRTIIDLNPSPTGMVDVNGRKCHTTYAGQLVKPVPVFFEATVRGRTKPTKGSWTCDAWATYAGPPIRTPNGTLRSGSRVAELDGREEFGDPGAFYMARYALADHWLFDDAEDVFTNAGSELIEKRRGRNHWHLVPGDGEMHETTLRVEPGNGLHIVTTWLQDGVVVQRRDTEDYERLAGRKLDRALTAVRAHGWRFWLPMTQTNKKHDPDGPTLAVAEWERVRVR